ncbi:MAG: PD-(D/E)XK nuclease family protein [Burkholderiales bacterium]
MASVSRLLLTKDEVFKRLADARGGTVSVVTPNQRLAAALAAHYAEFQAAQGLVVWEAADILPLSALYQRLYEDALYSELAPKIPMLLSGIQEQAIWEGVIAGSEAGSLLLSAASAATLAREAWTLAHAWQLLPNLRDFFGNEDTRVFADWAWRYEGSTARDRQSDRARLSDVLIPHLPHAALRKPSLLVAWGFDILTPQQSAFFDALVERDVELAMDARDAPRTSGLRLACATEKQEIEAAARWARARLEAATELGGGCRVGVVVPDLAGKREAVIRTFSRVLAPGRELDAQMLPFNVSMGVPLSDMALARAALRVLDIAGNDCSFDDASHLIRSPFIAGAQSESAERACLDAALRAVCAPQTSLERLRRAITRQTTEDNPYAVRGCPVLMQALLKFATCAKENLSGAKRAGDWARSFLALLEAIGFPGERTLDSAEYQALQKLHECFAQFAALDRVAGRMRFAQARALLRRAVTDTLFQPEAHEVPVQILGVLESSGLEFDHLWVMGLSEDAWPLPANPNPFIPVALQKRAGVPEASSSASHELDARIMRRWLAQAGEVVFSHPLKAEDRVLRASSLIAGIAECRVADLGRGFELNLSPNQDAGGAVRVEVLEFLTDRYAPAIAKGSSSAGGTSVFRDQAACPFKAYAIHRLRARPLDTASDLDASDRGTLTHKLLDKIWRELKSSAALHALAQRDLDALIATAADTAINSLRWRRPEALSGRLLQLERERLIRVATYWLAAERERPAFEIVGLEQKESFSFGGLAVNAKLDRMDRILGVDGGAWAVLDYKTGRTEVSGWLGARPDEPQLPLYAAGAGKGLGSDAKVVALAYARPRAGAMDFLGIAREDNLIPGVRSLSKQRADAAKAYYSWEHMLSSMRAELEALGREFMSGDARVDPKRGEKTCGECQLQGLCRISERESFSTLDDVAQGEGPA